MLAEDERCYVLVDGHRCLRRRHSDDTPHDPSLTPWISVLNLRRQRQGLPPYERVVKAGMEELP